MWSRLTKRMGLLITVGALAACEGHGTYTSKFLDEAAADRALLRSATQYDMAVQQFHSGDMERALQTIDSSMALSDNNAMAYLLKGRILLELGRTDTAVTYFDRGAALDPNEPGFSYYRAIAFERVGQLEGALAGYQRAASIDPTNAQYLLAAAETLVELERLDEAHDLLASQKGDFQSSAGFRQALGHIAILRGEYEEAIRYFIAAAVLSPDDPVFREDLCHAQVAAGQFVQAEVTARRLLDEDGYGDRRDLQHLRASCLIQLDRPVEARSLLFRLARSRDIAIDLDAWIKLIDVAMMLHDDDLLLMVANRLLAAAPGRHEGFLAMALWQRGTGDLDGAVRSLDRAIDRAGDDPIPRQLQFVIRRQLAGNLATK